MTSDSTDRLYFRQLLAGRDIARTDPIARQMVNFVYLVGDRETGEAVVIDAAYDVAGILDVLAADGMRLTGALATHYHADHVGGDMMGHGIEGVHELLELGPGAGARAGRRGAVGAAGHRHVGHRSGAARGRRRRDGRRHPDRAAAHAGPHAGEPGFLVDNRLVAGDTLFLEAAAAIICQARR